MDNPVTQASLSAEKFDLKHPCPTQSRELAAIIDTTNEKPFTNIIPNQPTILIISNSPKEFAFSKSKTSHACIFLRLVVCQLFHLLLFSPIQKAVFSPCL